jgi:hypothetical protein
VRAASLLWARDERRARTLVRETLGGIGELLQAASSPEAYLEDASRFGQLYQMRNSLLETVSQRDPALALDLLRTSRVPSNPALEGYVNQDLNLEAQLLNLLATKSPKAALAAAEETLERGVSYGLLNLIQSIRTTDPEAAAKLASAIVARLQSENLLAGYEIAQVAVSLLHFHIASETKGEGGEAPRPLLGEADVRQLMGQVVEAALADASSEPNATGVAQNLRNQLRPMVPAVVRYAPDYAAALQELYGQEVKAPADEHQAFWTRWNESAEKGDVDGMLAVAASAPQSYRDGLYQQAATTAFSAGDTARAHSIITSNVSNPYMRAQMLAELDQRAAEAAAQENDMARARSAVSRLRTADERVTMLLRMATGSAAGNKKMVQRLLDDALGELGERPRTTSQFQLMLQVADATVPLDPARAGSLLEPLVGQLNALASAAAALDGFDCQQGFREGELIEGGSQVATLVQGLASSLGTLAAADFDRAKATGSGAERPEIRVALLLAVAQSTLNATEKGKEAE